MRKLKTTVIALGAFVIYYVVVAFVLNQPTCIFRNTIGIPCPGCGMTRSYIHLLHGDIAGAWEMHPLFGLVPILGVFAASDYILRKRQVHVRKGLSYMLRGGMTVCVALFIGVYVYRMVTLFPNTEPMVFNHQAFWPSIIRIFLS